MGSELALGKKMSLIDFLKKNVAIGTFSKTLDSAFIEAAGLAGLDFIILDQEHGAASFETLHHHVRAARLTNMSSIVRVKGVDAHAIGAALDTGASGVQVPNVNNAQQAEEAVNAARFYPIGQRGVCCFVRAAEFGSQDKAAYFDQANKSLLVLQVEGLEGVKNLDAILDVKGFDVLFVGPYDLSQSVGKPGEISSPEVIKLIREIAMKAKERNVILGAFCDTPENAELLQSEGFTYIAFSVDINIYLKACQKLKELKS